MSSVVNFSVLVFPVHLIFSVLFFLIYFLTHFHLFYILVFFLSFFSHLSVLNSYFFCSLFYLSVLHDACLMAAAYGLISFRLWGAGQIGVATEQQQVYSLYSIFSGSGSRSSLELKSGFRKNLNAVPHLGFGNEKTQKFTYFFL